MHSAKQTLPSALKNTRWRFGFAECLTTGTRQTITAVSRFDGWRTRRPRAQMLPSACPTELGTGILCRVLDFCRVLELGKNGMYRVQNLCRVPGARHSAKSLFAECPWFGTRQITKHSAYMPVSGSGHTGIKMAMGTRNPSTRWVLPDKKTGMEWVFYPWIYYWAKSCTHRI